MLSTFFTWPHFFSYLRIILTPVFLYLAYHGYANGALICLLTAGFTDWADGFLARKLGQETDFGQMLDPIADKILLIASYLGFWWLGHITYLMCVVVVGRDVLLLLMGALIIGCRLNFSMKPLYISKVNTTLQIAYIAAIIMSFPEFILVGLGLSVIATTLVSGILYISSFLSWYVKR